MIWNISTAVFRIPKVAAYSNNAEAIQQVERHMLFAANQDQT